jgi:hypothetical protein
LALVNSYLKTFLQFQKIFWVLRQMMTIS